MKKIITSTVLLTFIALSAFYYSYQVKASLIDEIENGNIALEYEDVPISVYNSVYLNNPKMVELSSKPIGQFIYTRYYLKDTIVNYRTFSTGICANHNASLASTTINLSNIEVFESSYEIGIGFTVSGRVGIYAAELDREAGFIRSYTKESDLFVSKKLVSKAESESHYSASGKYCLNLLDRRATIITVKKSIITGNIVKVERVTNGTLGIQSTVLPKSVPTTPPSPSC